MPIDANIALGVKPMQIESPMNQMAQMYQLQNAQSQNELAKYTIDKAQREDQMQNALYSRLQDPNFDPTNAEHVKGLYQYGTPGIGVIKSIGEQGEKALQQKKITGEIATSDYALKTKQHDETIKDLASTTNAVDAAAAIDKYVTDKKLTADEAAQLKASIPTDSTQYGAWQTKMLTHLNDAKTQLEITKPNWVERTNGQLKWFEDINSRSPTFGKTQDVMPLQVSPNTTATINAQATQGNLNRQNAKDVAKLRNSGELTPEQNDALYGPDGAVTTGKLDPYKISSRNSHILANAYLSNPNTDMNKLASDAAMMRNAPTMNRAYTAEQLPTIISNVVDAGKKVNYSDAKFFGKVQEFINGQSNDPNFINYMTQRNDALITITGVMRGNGATDQAHRAEIEAAPSTMSPKAFDAWAAGQMKALEPRLKQANKFTRTQPAPATTTAPAQAVQYATNGATRLMSTDGGITWNPVK